MSKEIIVNKGKQTRIAIVENGELAELFIENQEHERTIGNIFLGRIRRVMPSIQAAFVDIGQKQDAFLHFSDLIDNVESWLDFVQTDQAEIGTFKGEYTTKPAGKKRRRPRGQDRGGRGGSHNNVADKRSKDRRKSAHGRQHGSHDSRGRDDDAPEQPKFDPTQILKKDQPILVKISKEPIANKGSRITTDISLAGRFLVLVPMANYVAVSKKIMSFKERRRLRALARSLLPEGFGVIVRTVAEGRSAKALDTDLNLLVDKWKKMEGKLKTNPKPPSVIHEDVNMVSSIMRDLFTEDYDRIIIDDQKLYRNIRGYVQAIAPDMVEDVQLESDADSVFQKVGIKDSVEEAFDERVNMPSGGYLFFEQTEAMHVVDVNSGRAGRGMSQEDSSLKVNLEAAKIICKQVRLRDLGGIIVVDFIDMRHEGNRRKLYETLKKEFRSDRAVTKVLPMSDFGLIQITRQRLRPSITKTFSLPDEQAQEAQQDKPARRKQVRDRSIEPSHLRVEPEDLLHKIEEWLGEYREAGLSARVRLKVHPFTASFLRGKFPSRTFRWRLRFGVRVEIDSDPSVDPMSFRFFDGKSGKEISRLPRRKDRKPRRKPDDQKRSGSGSKGQAEAESDKKQSSDGRRSGGGRSGNSRSRNSGSSRGSDTRRDGNRERGGERSGERSGGGRRNQGRNQSREQGRSDERGQERNERRSEGRRSGGRADGRKDGRRDSRGESRGRDREERRETGGSENRSESRQNRRSDKQSENRSAKNEGRRTDKRQEKQEEGQGSTSGSDARSDRGQRSDNRSRSGNRSRSDDRRRDEQVKEDVKVQRSKEAISETEPTSSPAEPTVVPAPEAAASEAPVKESAMDSSPETAKPETTKPESQKPETAKPESKGKDADKDTEKKQSKGAKSAASENQGDDKPSEVIPASNRFMKIDLRSDKG